MTTPLPLEIWWQILIQVPYRDIFLLRRINHDFDTIITSKVFWEQKAQEDFGVSYRFYEQKWPWSGYAYLLVQNNMIGIGCEEFLSTKECLQIALDWRDLDLLRYFSKQCRSSDQGFLMACHSGADELIQILPRPTQRIIIDIGIFLARSRGHEKTARMVILKYGLDSVYSGKGSLRWNELATGAIKLFGGRIP